MTRLLERVAGAPITWGVDGSPGWGHLMNRDRVMAEMRDVGLHATELGPDGYLPTDPGELTEYVARYGLHVVGGFVPALLYLPDRVEAELEYVERAAGQLQRAGSKVLVLGPSSHHPGYDISVEMSDDEWTAFLRNLDRLRAVAEERDLVTALHPHWGMAIERQHHVERLYESSEVGLCLDTGHLYLAGADPVAVAAMAPERVHHVHLKDVDGAFAARVRSGDIAFRRATIDGMFVPVGQGDVDIAGVIRLLEASGYQGWYVLEQDVSLGADPDPGRGPVVDAKTSVDWLAELAADLDGS